MKPAEATNEVGVVVLNYNCHDFLETCIQSVLDQTYKGIAIWIVDNGSTDDSVELVRNRFADLPLIEIKANRGFAAMNIGTKAALQNGCKYVFYLDSDAKLEPEAVERLVGHLERQGNCGIVGPQQFRYPGGKPYFIGGCVDVRTAWATWVGTASGPTDFDFVGNALVRREVLEQIEFDEQFFTYYADVDFCVRAKALGYKVTGVPSARMHSFQGLSSSTIPGLRGYVNGRNRLIFVAKHTPRHFVLVAIVLMALVSGLRFGSWALKRQIREAAFVLIGFTSGFLMLVAKKEPSTWRDLAIRGLGNRIQISEVVQRGGGDLSSMTTFRRDRQK